MRGWWLVMTALLVHGVAPAPAYAEETGTGTSTPSIGAMETTPSGQGFSTTFANGFWGGGLYGQEARLALPVGTELVRIQARAQIIHFFGDPYRLDFGARLGVVGGSLPLMNFLRAYGSGGVGLIFPITPDGIDKKVRIGLSGEFGIEVLISPGMGIFVEAGGGGYFNGSYANGGHAMAGMNFYPFSF